MGDKPEDVLSSTVEALKNADVSKIEAGFQVSEVTDETPTVRRGRKVAESMGGRGGEVECQGTGHGRNPFPPLSLSPRCPTSPVAFWTYASLLLTYNPFQCTCGMPHLARSPI